ncbi:winged helix-turn-helix domain-containing protein [Enterobacter kobei]|uniref:winged helix-turn-helix domain-containing protein n=1 Tax=Enterobacter kobei TaxID=208224 RepID=UPI001ABDD1E7|nr:winged helix-turn-helix domain-containing protein [Enterobacter kobei]MBO4154601.1 winged helix-turn-helix domain-containing protein [Enterobacter kobei]UOY68666.1 winged helix-turn-helix domain-containing protein [Enterobacter kobei]
MNKKFILNDRVAFSPADNKLMPLGVRGREVILHTPASRFLFLLISKEGNIITQEEIYREVWEKYGQRVTPNTLYQNVSLLRKGLKTAGITSLIIKTHPKSGFSFYGQVQEFEDEELWANKDTKSVSAMTAEPETELTPDATVEKKQTGSATVEAKKTKLARIKAYIPLIRFGLIFFVISILFLILMPSSTDEHFTLEQNLVARVNGCPVYVDRGNRRVDLSKILQYLDEKNIGCREHDFLYITKAPNINRVIIMSCNSDSEDIKCSLLFKLPAYLTPAPKRQ